jgi:hypothetical protein
MEPGTLFRVKGYKAEFESVMLGSLVENPMSIDDHETELPLGEIGVVLEIHKKESNQHHSAYRVLVCGKQGWLFHDEMEVVDEAG